jgi:signal transduction histidine kinase
MTLKTVAKKEEGNPVKLVWLITLLSFSVGVFMVYIIWSSFTNIRTEREKLFSLKETFNTIEANLESSLTEQKSQISALLVGDNTDIYSSEQNYILLDLIKDYNRAVSKPDLLPVFEELEKDIYSLFSVKEKLSWWASAHNRITPKIPEVRKKVRTTLDRIFETVDSAEGKQRLERAAKIKQIRNGASSKVDIELINEIAVSNEFSIIQRDIADLVQLSEFLHIVTETENLTDIKDNKIRTLLARIRSNTRQSEGEESPEKIQLNNLLDDYETALFGQGYDIDNELQLITLGYEGEYGLILDQLKLIEEKELLRQEISLVYEKIDSTIGKVLSRTDAITQQEATKVEKVLGQTWRTMVIIWIVTSLIYVMLAYEIIMAAKQQIKAIEDSNLELEAMANELKKSEERLHRLSSDLFSVQENERRRISLELHDELGQSMAALKLQVSSVARRLGDAPEEELKVACNDMRDNINQIIENVRRLSRDLSPVVLNDLGLQAAIEYLVNNFSKIYNVTIRYKKTDINHLFDEDSQRIIYRILQEALTNIGKHAQATNVTLTIEDVNRSVQFAVRDDGKGFNVQKTLDKKGDDRGMGLEAMAERVRILGGKISIVSRPGIDTTITFTAPMR